MARFIIFTYQDWEASGGLHDAVEDENGVKVFKSEEQIQVFLTECHADNVQIVDVDKLEIIEEYEYIWADYFISGHYEKI